jgi:hypothetical protein
MNTTHPPTTTTGLSVPTRSRRRWRYRLLGLVIFAVTIAFLYAEENWRGRRVWENCKRELEAKGAKLDWSYYIPPPVPDDQNIFGVPEMQKWFVGRGPTELSKKFHFPGYDTETNSAPPVLANLTIGLPGATPPGGSTVLDWSDAKKSPGEAARLMAQALGPFVKDPNDHILMVNRPEEVRPARIFLQCQAAPTEKALYQFLTDAVDPRVPVMPETRTGWGRMRLEPAGSNSYQVTLIEPPCRVADYVAWSETIEPDLAVIRQAVQRPFARMPGDYSFPLDIPVPNFVTTRTVSQRLSALARCYLVLGQPGKALEEVTLMHQLCRILEARPTGQPMTLVAAMINVAFTGLYVDTIKDGMRMQAWQEPQLAALQEQLKEINLRPYLIDAFAGEQAWGNDAVEMTPLTEMGKIWRRSDKPDERTKMLSFPYCAVPRGWYYQNMAVCAHFHQIFIDDFSSAGQLVAPHKLDPFNPMMDALVSRRSPFILLAAISIPNYLRAATTYTHIQTLANQAQIVCALERHRLARGQYPATLEELIPPFIEKIPRDLIGGELPHYRRNADGTFLLYSIGWTEQDHGGHAGPKDNEGDWVWGAEQ